LSPAVLVRLAQRSLLQHKLRSTLSVVGIVFGVAAVTAISSVAAGASREALAQIGALGIDSITLRARPAPAELPGALRLPQAEAIAAVVPGLVAVAPVREATLAAQAGSRHTDAIVVGTTPAYQSASRLRVASGRFLAGLDVQDRKRVAVLGAGVAQALFPLGDALGQRLRLADEVFDVVGVLEGRPGVRSKSSGPIRTRDVNRAVFVPLPSLDRGGDPRPDGVDEIVVRVADASGVAASAEVARNVVRRTSGQEGFDVIVPREILRQKERTQRIFNVVTGAVAAISLLVGGIGIMNIMLASVAERTREVGIRRAVGASQRDIAAQFLVEASLLTGMGGVIGTVLGLVAAVLIQAVAGWPTAVSAAMLLAALLTAVGVGVGFGSYPAWQAAQLQPMEALRQ
jgi:putative ABC transport system permease protein